MIIDLEKLKKARTALGIIWTTMSGDSHSAPYVEFVRDLLRDVIDDLEIYGHSTIKLEQKGVQIYELILTAEELFYLQKAVVLYDTKERDLKRGYSAQDKEFNRQLVVKLLSTEERNEDGT